MKATSFFTDAEIELALALASEVLDDQKAMDELESAIIELQSVLEWANE